jgi:hypothetical protein
VPGILTALGLLATFSAILVALSGVSYNPGNTVQPVTGIDALINGLAGKFLSSIIALILSMIFTFVEKKVCERQILDRMDDVLSRVKQLFPFLSQTRLLLDLQRIALAAQNRFMPVNDENPGSEVITEPEEEILAADPIILDAPTAAEELMEAIPFTHMNGAGAEPVPTEDAPGRVLPLDTTASDAAGGLDAGEEPAASELEISNDPEEERLHAAKFEL